MEQSLNDWAEMYNRKDKECYQAMLERDLLKEQLKIKEKVFNQISEIAHKIILQTTELYNLIHYSIKNPKDIEEQILLYNKQINCLHIQLDTLLKRIENGN